MVDGEEEYRLWKATSIEKKIIQHLRNLYQSSDLSYRTYGIIALYKVINSIFNSGIKCVIKFFSGLRILISEF